MIRSLWIAKTGLDAQQTQLDVIANNLANVSTNGLQALARGVRGPAVPDAAPARRAVVAADAAADRPAARHRRAAGRDRAHLHAGQPAADRQLRSTSRSTATGFFQVQMPDGTTAYTRDGSFQLDAQGQLVTSSGFPLQPAITIPANAQSVTIGRDGVVSVTQPGQAAPTQVGSLQLANFVNPAGLQGARREPLHRDGLVRDRPRPTRPAPTGSAPCSRATSRPRTSTSSRSSST